MSREDFIAGTAPAQGAVHRRTIRNCALILAPLIAGLSACGGDSHPLSDTPYDATAQLSFGHADAASSEINPDEHLKVTTSGDGARITDVRAVDAQGRQLPGELHADGSGWSSASPMAGGTEYTVQVSTENGSGAPGQGTHSFATGRGDAELLDVVFGPEAGTYGVGQPVTAELSRAASAPGERALIEGALKVSSQPETVGAWHWVDDQNLRFRPQEYWPSGAEIQVSSELDGLYLTDGVRGGKGEPLTLNTGDRIEAVADVSTHTMTVKRDGEVLRTIPMTTGKEGFRTRNGKKVILSRESFVRMQGASIGIPVGSADSYDLPVHWAARLTWSGEYVHGAPWSAGSHGSANVSHGCTGLGTENARWFYDLIKPGDIVEHVNGEGEDMTPFDNGFGDWNLSWDEWQEGSALKGAGSQVDAAGAPRLRPAI